MSGDPSSSPHPHPHPNQSRRPRPRRPLSRLRLLPRLGRLGRLPLVVVLCCVALTAAAPAWSLQQGLQHKEHRTAAAAERANDLRCLVCESMDPLFGQNCVTAPANHTRLFAKRCRDDARICMTKSFSTTTSTENTTSAPRLFALERNCTNKCEPGCIVIGERTKLYACTQCCETNLCNTGSGRGNSLWTLWPGRWAGWAPWAWAGLLLLRAQPR